jgi:polyferredoxin
MSPRWPDVLTRDIQEFAPVRRMVRLRAFQFLLILPTALIVAVVLISAAVGIEHPNFNFGTVFTWVVWWGALLLSFIFMGRAWCLVCPVGAVGEWIQRASLWWRSPYTVGYNFRWPRPFRNLWLPTLLFLVFVWLDNGYGMSNSPRMTAGLIVVLTLGAAWIDLFFERRAFCRYVCPLTAFIGLNSLFSIFELRRREGATCRTSCSTKDCFRGNETRYGCPMGEFPGGGMDTNLHCILCAECVKSCPHDNVALRFRAPGRDLWEARRLRADGAFAAAIVVGLATILPFLMLTFLGSLRSLLASALPPGDSPRLLAVSILFAAGAAASVGVVYGGSRLSAQATGGNAVTTRMLFSGYAYALIPIGLFKFLADLLDHAFRTWGALSDVTRALLLDFPFNRAVPGGVTVVHLLPPTGVYALQVGLLLAGLLFSLHAMHRMAVRLAGEEAALASFIPVAGLAFVLTLAGVWTLGMAFL